MVKSVYYIMCDDLTLHHELFSLVNAACSLGHIQALNVTVPSRYAQILFWKCKIISLRKASLQNDIVSHEFTHGTSNRLTGGVSTYVYIRPTSHV